MRTIVTDFTANPSNELVNQFDAAQNDAFLSLGDIRRSSLTMRDDSIETLRSQLIMLKTNFEKLVAEQYVLGFTRRMGYAGSCSRPATMWRRTSARRWSGSTKAKPAS